MVPFNGKIALNNDSPQEQHQASRSNSRSVRLGADDSLFRKGYGVANSSPVQLVLTDLLTPAFQGRAPRQSSRESRMLPV